MCSTWQLANIWLEVQNIHTYLLYKPRWEAKRAAATQPTPVATLLYNGVVLQDAVPPMDVLANSGKIHLHLPVPGLQLAHPQL